MTTNNRQTEHELAFDQFLADSLPRLLFYLRAHFGLSTYDAEDIAQTVFLKLFRMTIAPENWTQFLFGAARYAVCDFYHQKKRPISDASIGPMLDLPDPRIEVEQQEEITAIREAMRKLPSMDRELIVLRYFSGLTYQQVSEFVDITPSTARAHTRMAIAHLQALLESRQPQMKFEIESLTSRLTDVFGHLTTKQSYLGTRVERLHADIVTQRLADQIVTTFDGLQAMNMELSERISRLATSVKTAAK